jgi:hypothetical protein
MQPPFSRARCCAWACLDAANDRLATDLKSLRQDAEAPIQATAGAAGERFSEMRVRPRGAHPARAGTRKLSVPGRAYSMPKSCGFQEATSSALLVYSPVTQLMRRLLRKELMEQHCCGHGSVQYSIRREV